jgi:hypothetical protein
MRRWLGIGGAVLSVVGWVGVLTGGCSSAVAPYPDAESFCSALAEAQCGGGDGGPSIAALCGVTAETCIAAAQQTCTTNASTALMDTGRAYTQANAPACIEATQAAYSMTQIPAATLATLASTCDAVFAGNAAIGASCTSTASCAQTETDGGTPSAVCAPVQPGSKVMQCAMAVAVSEGMPCANIGDVCPAGTFCTGVPAECHPGGTVGASCTPTVGCSAGAFCNINAGAKTGSCIQGGEIGSSCTTSANCGTSAPYCDLNVKPESGGGKATGSCEIGLSFATEAPDCKALGAQ